MKITRRFRRDHAVRRIRGQLERSSFPRLQMFLLVTLTGAAGFVASFLLLHAGLLDMGLRYLVSFGVAYLVFLLLLWLWLRTSAQDYIEIPDLSGSPSSSSGSGSGSGESAVFRSGQGGDFAGGGASASFEATPGNTPLGGDAAGTIGDALGSAAEAEELAIPLVVLVLIGAIILSSLFMVYSAPLLFAELLVDGALSASLYRRLRGLDARHWLETAVRRTALPFALTAIVVSATGWAMQLYAPGATSIGAVMAHAKQGS